MYNRLPHFIALRNVLIFSFDDFGQWICRIITCTFATFRSRFFFFFGLKYVALERGHAWMLWSMQPSIAFSQRSPGQEPLMNCVLYRITSQWPWKWEINHLWLRGDSFSKKRTLSDRTLLGCLASYQSTNQSINQSINQPINQSLFQSNTKKYK